MGYRHIPPETRDQAIRLLQAGTPVPDVARQCGLAEGTVHRMKARNVAGAPPVRSLQYRIDDEAAEPGQCALCSNTKNCGVLELAEEHIGAPKRLALCPGCWDKHGLGEVVDGDVIEVPAAVWLFKGKLPGAAFHQREATEPNGNGAPPPVAAPEAPIPAAPALGAKEAPEAFLRQCIATAEARVAQYQLIATKLREAMAALEGAL